MVHNESVIATISQQLKEVSTRIESIALTQEALRANKSSFDENLEDFLYDEVRHAQVLILELTRIIIPPEEANGDGSVFNEGELTEEIKEKEQEPPDEE